MAVRVLILIKFYLNMDVHRVNQTHGAISTH